MKNLKLQDIALSGFVTLTTFFLFFFVSFITVFYLFFFFFSSQSWSSPYRAIPACSETHNLKKKKVIALPCFSSLKYKGMLQYMVAECDPVWADFDPCKRYLQIGPSYSFLAARVFSNCGLFFLQKHISRCYRNGELQSIWFLHTFIFFDWM